MGNGRPKYKVGDEVIVRINEQYTFVAEVIEIGMSPNNEVCYDVVSLTEEIRGHYYVEEENISCLANPLTKALYL